MESSTWQTASSTRSHTPFTYLQGYNFFALSISFYFSFLDSFQAFSLILPLLYHSHSLTMQSQGSSADFKELIPEFFFLPEFLINRNNYDLGRRQDGVVLDNVDLPPWAAGDARRFVRMMRKALESPHVSSCLHRWIDLIFGFSQRGEHAEEHNNLFLPLSYEDNPTIKRLQAQREGDPGEQSLESRVEEHSAMTIIKQFGQTPSQLFTEPHPARFPEACAARQTLTTVTVNKLAVSMQETCHFVPSFLQMAGDSIEPLPHHRLPVAVPWTAEPLSIIWKAWDGALHVVHSKLNTSLASCSMNSSYVLSTVASDRDYLATGSIGGVVQVFRLEDGSEGDGAATSRQPSMSDLKISSVCTLLGHNAPVTCCHVNKDFGLLVTGDTDGVLIIWDIYQQSAMHMIETEFAISVITSSRVTGDIAYGFAMEKEHKVRLISINAMSVGSWTSTVPITALATTTDSHGFNDNGIVVGLADGSVAMLSDMDMSEIWKFYIPSQSSSKQPRSRKARSISLSAGDDETLAGQLSLDPFNVTALFVADNCQNLYIGQRSKLAL